MAPLGGPWRPLTNGTCGEKQGRSALCLAGIVLGDSAAAAAACRWLLLESSFLFGRPPASKIHVRLSAPAGVLTVDTHCWTVYWPLSLPPPVPSHADETLQMARLLKVGEWVIGWRVITVAVVSDRHRGGLWTLALIHLADLAPPGAWRCPPRDTSPHTSWLMAHGSWLMAGNKGHLSPCSRACRRPNT